MKSLNASEDLLAFAKSVIEIEKQGLSRVLGRLGESFVESVQKISNCQGKIILTGMGKSGHVGQKISSTLSSTGTPSIFLHPAEALHGDMGIISKSDMVIAISNSGESDELMSIVRFCRRKGVLLVALSGNEGSSLSTHSDFWIDTSVEKEACPLGLAPTASTTATLAVGDALAMAVLRLKGFTSSDFAERHPSGSLGARLLTRVKDLMHTGDAFPCVKTHASIADLLSEMTKKEVQGAAGVVNDLGVFVGVVTDGDIRRHFEKNNMSFDFTAKDLMTSTPKTIEENELAEDALNLMERSKVQKLFVCRKGGSTGDLPLGVIGIQDLLQAKVR